MFGLAAVRGIASGSQAVTALGMLVSVVPVDGSVELQGSKALKTVDSQVTSRVRHLSAPPTPTPSNAETRPVFVFIERQLYHGHVCRGMSGVRVPIR